MSQSTKCFGSIVSLQCFIDIYWKVTDKILNKILYKYELSFLSGLGPCCPKLAKQQQGEQAGGNVPSQRFFQVLEPSVQNWQKSDTFDRTIDLSSLGLDFNDVNFSSIITDVFYAQPVRCLTNCSLQKELLSSLCSVLAFKS